MVDFSVLKGRTQFTYDIPDDLRTSWQIDKAKNN